MRVYLAAWIFPTSFGSVPLLFHARFLIGQTGPRGSFTLRYKLLSGSHENAASFHEPWRVQSMGCQHSEQCFVTAQAPEGDTVPPLSPVCIPPCCVSIAAR